MERFVILLALAGLSYLLLYTEGLVKTSRARFAVLGVLLVKLCGKLFPDDKAEARELRRLERLSAAPPRRTKRKRTPDGGRVRAH